MTPQMRVFESPEEVARSLASEFEREVVAAKNRGKAITVALSGGSTPGLFFERLAAEPFRSTVPWPYVHFYWSDERCVVPSSAESNYGTSKRKLLDKIPIPPSNVHRIRGESEPEQEARRYEAEVKEQLPADEVGYPMFDWILLGLGADGHTASLFPESNGWGDTGLTCVVVSHPITGRLRITLTLPVINRAKRVTFVVTGKEKASIIKTLLTGESHKRSLPASLVSPSNGRLEWLLDRSAAALL